MSAAEERGYQHDSWASRLAGARLVLLAAALVLAGFVALDALAPLQGVIGFAVIAAAALVGSTARRVSSAIVPAASRPGSPLASPLIDAMIAALPDAVLALDPEGIVIAHNAGAVAVAPALRVGEPASFALRVPEVVEAVRLAAASGEAQRIEFSDRVPVDRWYEAHVIGVHLTKPRHGGPPDFVLMTIRDLTPLRRVEEMRADFVANASHELRTPLATLSGFIETLQGPAREDTAARERFLVIMKQQAFRMARLIDDLLSLSRIELNVHVRPEAPVDLAAIVRQVTDAMQMLAHDRGVEITVNGPPKPLIVPGDRDELVRVFENLVENALKYGAAGKRVKIAVACEDDEAGLPEARVSVRDFGPGIAPEHLPRLTERFYRVDVAQSRAEGGTGLGLAIVKHILARHQGRLEIDSILGQGAAFTAHLPLAPTSAVLK
jgi:two-component system, OmpR family, phosphate regulon sensor histidine kinase PhoR